LDRAKITPVNASQSPAKVLLARCEMRVPDRRHEYLGIEQHRCGVLITSGPTDCSFSWREAFNMMKTINKDTPFPWFKQNASKLGGVRRCMAVS
jgi:hypothetical protein